MVIGRELVGQKQTNLFYRMSPIPNPQSPIPSPQSPITNHQHMNIETFREYCLAKKGVEETFPFDENTLVFKVMGKMFALTGLEHEEFKVNLKCDPEKAAGLRAEFPDDILPGWHMSKLHWNTVRFEGGLELSLLKELIDHSYDLVVKKLTKKVRQSMDEL